MSQLPKRLMSTRSMTFSRACCSGISRGPRRMTPAYALYRRSLAHQDLSVEEQRRAVRTWAAEHDFEIIREFADDASGLDTERRRESLALLELCSRPERRAASTV